MPSTRRIASNVLSNWFALAITTLVGFFLSPFVVHHLGNLAYGVWVMIASLVGYMNLLDLGLQSAVIRFVSKGVAQKNEEESSQAVSGALWIRLWISLAIVCAGLLFAALFEHFFVIPVALQRAARLTIILSAITVAVNLWCGVFRGVLVALHRYDLSSAVSIVQTSLRAVGFVVLLRWGDGILALALWELCISVIANAVTVSLCFWIYPRLKLIFARPDRATLRKLVNYSSYIFVINIAVQIAYFTDNLVVGGFINPAAVTLYAIGGVVIAYARQIVASMATTFAPLASTFEAEAKFTHLQRLLIHGTRAAVLVSLPIEAALFFRGETFIRLWMGEQYAHPSGTVMKILLLSVVFTSANATSGGVAYGMEKLRAVAVWAIAEGAANLILSVILVRQIGIYGVAWGTSIPSLVVELFLWPRFVCKLVDIPVRTYLWQTWIRSSLAVIPFALACAVAERFWPAHNLAVFFLQITVLLPLLPLALFVIFRTEVSTRTREWLRQRHASADLGNAYESSSGTTG